MHHFVVSDISTGAPLVTFDSKQSHHLRRVLRMRHGDRVLVLDGLGSEYIVSLDQFTDDQVVGTITGPSTECTQAPREVSISVCVPKGDRWEWLLEKATELGVSRITPLQTRYSQPGVVAIKDRHRDIMREAVEQCGRLLLPSIEPERSLVDVIRQRPAISNDVPVLLWEGSGDYSLSTIISGIEPTQAINLLIGPEGGFHPDEIEMARAAGVVTAGIGPLIMRTETAAIVALALTMAGAWVAKVDATRSGGLKSTLGKT